MKDNFNTLAFIEYLFYIWCMETLVKRMRHGDYVHELVKRNEYVAMYETRIEGEILGYGVFCIRTEPGLNLTLAGHEIKTKPRELFPTKEMFGTLAFAIDNKADANRRFDFLTGRVEMKLRGICLN